MAAAAGKTTMQQWRRKRLPLLPSKVEANMRMGKANRLKTETDCSKVGAASGSAFAPLRPYLDRGGDVSARKDEADVRRGGGEESTFRKSRTSITSMK
jgi:hypothetical protein